MDSKAGPGTHRVHVKGFTILSILSKIRLP